MPDTPKSALIVENSAKIFDEKLTAFIRQNSCSNACSLSRSNSIFISDQKAEEETLEEEFVSNDIIDQLITLSAEKRTISPPMTTASSPSKASSGRTNSSSIDIGKVGIIAGKSSTKAETKKQANFNSTLGSSTLNSTSNRLSYNDSCYYSSSSSSCSSSVGSTQDDNYLAHLNWFKQDQQLIQQQQQPPMQSSLVATSSFYDEKEDPLNQDSFSNQFLFKPANFYSNLEFIF